MVLLIVGDIFHMQATRAYPIRLEIKENLLKMIHLVQISSMVEDYHLKLLELISARVL